MIRRRTGWHGWACSVAMAGAVALCGGPAGAAGSGVTCGGAAMLGGAQLNCSYPAKKPPSQLCTFSWALTNADNTPRVVQGSFSLISGASNVTVYQGSGFTAALSNPIVLCQAGK